VPLSSSGDVLGVLSLATSVPGGFNSRERKLLQTLANNAATAVQNAQLFKQRESEAIRAGLTWLYNHRFFQERLAQEEERARRYGRFFSVIILDIDHFKIYNDNFGHPAGDQLLIALARILEESIRGVDMAARYGGEEFAIVLPECEKPGAVLVAQRIREKVEEYANPHQEIYNLTISAGVSTFPEDGQTAPDVVNKADQALYRAKKEGRNRVVY